MKSINCNGTLIDLSTPKVMGILNCTPDSFFDGGKYHNSTAIVNQVEKMLCEGATFIDVGAYSSRPGAKHISEEEELDRILPVIKLLISEFSSALISVDTFRSNVAAQCIHNGACIVNDISAGEMDASMFSTVAKLQIPYIMMHMQGTPRTMQQAPQYTDVVAEVTFFLSERLRACRAAGTDGGAVARHGRQHRAEAHQTGADQVALRAQRMGGDHRQQDGQNGNDTHDAPPTARDNRLRNGRAQTKTAAEIALRRRRLQSVRPIRRSATPGRS